MTYDDFYRIAIFVNGFRHRLPYPSSFWFNPPTTGQYALYTDVRPYRFDHSTTFNLNLHANATPEPEHLPSRSERLSGAPSPAASPSSYGRHAMRDLYFRIELQILHGLYTDEVEGFKKSVSL